MSAHASRARVREAAAAGAGPARPDQAHEAAARAAVRALLRRARSGTITITEPGRATVSFGHGAPRAHLAVHSPAVWPALLRGSRGLAEAYRDGLWDSPDVVDVVRVAARNAGGLDRLRRLLAPLLRPWQLAHGTARRNGRRASRRQIAAHYDLGNDMFELMLDPTLMYSCAHFEREDMTLEQAQVAKLELICEGLELGPDDHLLEIGTGWGGLALHAAATRGCRVTTTTISREQHEHARTRVRAAGLADRVTVLRQDYRDLRGRYDKLVSVEMIEAVGWRNFGVFFRHCSDLLRDDGAMLLQAITIDDHAYEVEKTAQTFIRTHIFPSGCLPSLAVIRRHLARDTDMRVAGVQDLTASYVRTLRAWRERFDASRARLEELGYDERFRRMWRFYLAYCEAGFAERRIGDVQLLLTKPGHARRPRPASPSTQ